MLFLFLSRCDAILGEIILFKVIDTYNNGRQICWHTLPKGVTLENKTIHTRPLSPTFKVEESAVVSYRHSSSNSSIPLNGGGEGRGGRQSLSKAL